MSPDCGDKEGGEIELTLLIDIGLWQSMLDSLSAWLGAGIRIVKDDGAIILQSGLAALCREAVKRAGKHPSCVKCCGIEDFSNYERGGFALCAYCDRMINYVFNLSIGSIERHVIIGPVWIAEQGRRAAPGRQARKFGTSQAKFVNLSGKLRAYSLEEFREAGEMVVSAMRVITRTLSTSLDLASEVNRLKQSLSIEKKKTWRQMVRDQRTGVYQYNYGVARLKQEVARAERYKQSLSIVVIGIGEFRSYVDRYGPETVDELLKNIATLVQKKCRRTDLSVRIRQDEFLLILPFTAAEGARAALDRIRGQVEAMSFLGEKAAEVKPPSLVEGLASYPTDGNTDRELLRKAIEKARA